MINSEDFQEMALSFPNTQKVPHLERIGYKVVKRRMFATYLPDDNTANIFLSTTQQKVFTNLDRSDIYPVPNKWGEKGATTFELDTVEKSLIMEALLSAYNDIIKQK